MPSSWCTCSFARRILRFAPNGAAYLCAEDGGQQQWVYPLLAHSLHEDHHGHYWRLHRSTGDITKSSRPGLVSTFYPEIPVRAGQVTALKVYLVKPNFEGCQLWFEMCYVQHILEHTSPFAKGAQWLPSRYREWRKTLAGYGLGPGPSTTLATQPCTHTSSTVCAYAFSQEIRILIGGDLDLGSLCTARARREAEEQRCGSAKRPDAQLLPSPDDTCFEQTTSGGDRDAKRCSSELPGIGCETSIYGDYDVFMLSFLGIFNDVSMPCLGVKLFIWLVMGHVSVRKMSSFRWSWPRSSLVGVHHRFG